ncbi:MAG: helix-turn-helix transcriptional regulator, partial [Desulfocapsaceae bacterium]|nr:helix-turn-helix transcriptional regulator [Desulfocapsaceae bacterium]
MPLDRADNYRNIPRPIVAVAKEFPSGHLIPQHQHSRSQFLYASSGVMTVKTNRGMWVVPPLRAVWVPANTLHEIEVSGHLSMRTLYIDPTVFSGPSTECCVIAVTPLLRELILYAITLPQLYPEGGEEERLLTVILDQISSVDMAYLELPIPEDQRLKKIYDLLSATPGDNRTLDEWGKIIGATGRTLARHFRRQTGMSFGQWRQQFKILEALRRLGMNEPVTTVAIDLGYDSPSAFISMFKKTLGQTPGR